MITLSTTGLDMTVLGTVVGACAILVSSNTTSSLPSFWIVVIGISLLFRRRDKERLVFPKRFLAILNMLSVEKSATCADKPDNICLDSKTCELVTERPFNTRGVICVCAKFPVSFMNLPKDTVCWGNEAMPPPTFLTSSVYSSSPCTITSNAPEEIRATLSTIFNAKFSNPSL